MTYRGINIVFGLLLLVWPLFFFMSFFMFDAPGSESNPITLSLVASVWLYPFVYIVALLGSIIASKNRPKSRVPYYFAFLPLGCVLWFIVSIALLMVICDGDFSC